jgi:transcriptional regulator with XRE-family HTH domain
MFELNNVMEELIIECIKVRKDKKLTQEDVAKSSGLSQQMISRIETLRHIPSLDNFLLYLNALGIQMTFNIKEWL